MGLDDFFSKQHTETGFLDMKSIPFIQGMSDEEMLRGEQTLSIETGGGAATTT
jgi:hypothetical protein